MKTYMMLTKPGIILGNIVTTASGFALASGKAFDPLLFLATLIGLGLIIASAGILNNYIDRSSDAKMQRTKHRPFVTGAVPSLNALLLSLALLLGGMTTLAFFTNGLTLFIALFGFFVYLVLYAFLKYRSFYGTIVGSIAGAVPPVVGYCAVSDQVDLGAFLLFMVMVLWQMPHFFAIAIYHLDDYAAASIPVMPIVKGLYATKINMLLYIMAFIVTATLLTVTGYTGILYAGTAVILGLLWLGLCLYGFDQKRKQDKPWAYEMFIYSLVVIMALSVAIPIESYLS